MRLYEPVGVVATDHVSILIQEFPVRVLPSPIAGCFMIPPTALIWVHVTARDAGKLIAGCVRHVEAQRRLGSGVEFPFR